MRETPTATFGTTREAQADSSADRDALEFYFREHAHLRAEIESDKQHLRRLEIYAVIGAGGVWAWLASSSPAELQLGWFIPVVLGFFGLLQTRGIVKDIVARAEYLRGIEKVVHPAGELDGWETFLHKKRGGKDPAVLDWIFWGAYLSVAFGVPFLVLWRS